MRIEVFDPNNADEFLQRLMTPQKVGQVMEHLRAIIGGQYTLECPEDVRPQIMADIARSQICGIRGPKPSSTASVPRPDNPPRWVIGCFGSVWLDLAVDGQIVRVALAGLNVLKAEVVRS